MKRLTWINLIVGIWLIMAPFAMGGVATLTSVPVGNDVVLGILLVATSAWILVAETTAAGVAWFQALCGIWLSIAPFVLSYRGMPNVTRSDLIAGIIAIVVGVVESRGTVGTPRPA
jgi:hypothetical protein